VIAVVCGGVGAARFLSGLLDVVEQSEVVAIVNTGDDLELYGLSISPDLDTIVYSLSGSSNAETGWGLSGETWAAMEALDRFGAPTWFRLGDRDLATHLYRTARLGEGATLSQVTAEIVSAFGLGLAVVPMSDDKVRTRVALASGEEVSFQEYFVKLAHAVRVTAVRFEGSAMAAPAPGVLEALGAAERVVIAPSNPVVSIGPVLSVPGVRDVLAARRATVSAVSPIVAGAALKGPADRLLEELGATASVGGVAKWLTGVAATLVVDRADEGRVGEVESEQMSCVVTDTVMRNRSVAARLAEVAIGGTP